MPDDIPVQSPTAVAQRVLAILDTGRRTQSYKFALLIALIEEMLDGVDAYGRPPASTTATALAHRVLRLYWSQTRPIDEEGHAMQSGQRNGLVDHAARTKDELGLPASMTFTSFESLHPAEAAALRTKARMAIGRDAIPRLQVFGTSGTSVATPFLFETWAPGVMGHVGGDDALSFLPGAAEGLLAMGPLLRMVIEREWLRFVEGHNTERVPEPVLERQLFGAVRISLAPVVTSLVELHDGACFYCAGVLEAVDVDHFLPWSLSHDDTIDNLVPSCPSCNNDKRAALVGGDALVRWWARAETHTEDLTAIASIVGWPRDLARTRARARGLYRPHVEAGVPLWAGRGRAPISMSPTNLQELMMTSVPPASQLEQVLRALCDESLSMTPDAFRTPDPSRDVPGLYTWWVDEAGRETLVEVMGHVLENPIYCGQAGAVHGRQTSSATLRSRVGRNHIRGNIGSSTFRQTLAALLRP